MPRIAFGPTLFVVTAVTYAPSLKDGTWHTRVEAEQYTGPTEWTGAPDGGDYEAPTPIITLLDVPEYAGSLVAVLSAQTSDAPTGVVEAALWTFGDGGSVELAGPFAPEDIPPEAHPYPAEGYYVATLALRTQGVWCPAVAAEVFIPVFPLPPEEPEL